MGRQVYVVRQVRGMDFGGVKGVEYINQNSTDPVPFPYARIWTWPQPWTCLILPHLRRDWAYPDHICAGTCVPASRIRSIPGAAWVYESPVPCAKGLYRDGEKPANGGH